MLGVYHPQSPSPGLTAARSRCAFAWTSGCFCRDLLLPSVAHLHAASLAVPPITQPSLHASTAASMSWFKKKDEESAPPLPVLAQSEPMRGGQLSPQLEMMKESFTQFSEQLSAITGVCWDKCMTKKQQSELSIGEAACVDRCVLKQMATSNEVGRVFQAQMQAQQQQQPPAQ